MFNHQDIWRAIDRLAESSGYSPSGLAKRAGLDPTSFNKSKRISPDGKPRWPSTESVSKILSVTSTTMSDFISLISEDSATQQGNPKTIPLLGLAQAGRSGYFDEDGYPAGKGWDEINLPSVGQKDAEALYALSVSGDSMQPLYRPGDILVVSPTARIRKKDRVVVKTRSGEVMCKELERQDGQQAVLRSLNQDHETVKLGKRDITWMARILWVSQ